MDEQNKEFKKIALRFLKERGLYSKWKEYLYAKKIKGEKLGGLNGIGPNNWYEKKQIDRIFGQENFSHYLSHYCQYPVICITNEFRSYLKTFYEGQHSLFRKVTTINPVFDKDTHTFIKRDRRY
jgi:hypothetical protein